MPLAQATFDESFPRHWQAEVLPARPAILPARHYVYPRQAEEVERGALEVMVRPALYQGMTSGVPEMPSARTVLYQGTASAVPQNAEKKDRALAPEGSEAADKTAALEVSGHDFSRADLSASEDGALAPETPPTQSAQPFLATCALGFRDPAAPTGIWSAPHPDAICLVAGGYAYLIDTTAPERFTMIPYRPVLEVRAAVDAGLLLFVGHRSILAWGRNGQAWESEKLSDEGVTITAIEGLVLRGTGWEMLSDKETAFELDLCSGRRVDQL
jgi:hypothetical protein